MVPDALQFEINMIKYLKSYDKYIFSRHLFQLLILLPSVKSRLPKNIHLYASIFPLLSVFFYSAPFSLFPDSNTFRVLLSDLLKKNSLCQPTPPGSAIIEYFRLSNLVQNLSNFIALAVTYTGGIPMSPSYPVKVTACGLVDNRKLDAER